MVTGDCPAAQRVGEPERILLRGRHRSSRSCRFVANRGLCGGLKLDKAGDLSTPLTVSALLNRQDVWRTRSVWRLCRPCHEQHEPGDVVHGLGVADLGRVDHKCRQHAAQRIAARPGLVPRPPEERVFREGPVAPPAAAVDGKSGGSADGLVQRAAAVVLLLRIRARWTCATAVLE